MPSEVIDGETCRTSDELRALNPVEIGDGKSVDKRLEALGSEVVIVKARRGTSVSMPKWGEKMSLEQGAFNRNRRNWAL